MGEACIVAIVCVHGYLHFAQDAQILVCQTFNNCYTVVGMLLMRLFSPATIPRIKQMVRAFVKDVPF